MLKKKKIIFVPETRPEKYGAKLPDPKPARSYIPDWYKNAETWVGKGPRIEGYKGNAGLKKCVPFLDVMTSGYMLELSQEIQVKRYPGVSTAEITWLIKPDPIMLRGYEVGKTIPRPPGHDLDHWAWVGQFGFKLPPGYSALITHPFNRFDLPFTTMSGLMDSDAHFAAGNLPFFLKTDFEGFIPAGTPIAQVFPFKREAWKSETSYDKDLAWTASQMTYDARRVLSGYYKKTAWSRKDYS